MIRPSSPLTMLLSRHTRRRGSSGSELSRVERARFGLGAGPHQAGRYPHRSAFDRCGVTWHQRSAAGGTSTKSATRSQSSVHDGLFPKCHRPPRSARSWRRDDPKANHTRGPRGTDTRFARCRHRTVRRPLISSHPSASERLLVCRERSIVRGDEGRIMTRPSSRPEARSLLGYQTANELGAPVASSIPAQLPGHEPASARMGYEDGHALFLRY